MDIDQNWISLLKNEFLKLNIPPDEWKKFEKMLKPQKLKKDEFLIKEGDDPEKITFVISGLFRAFYITEKGEDKTIIFRGKGRILAAYSSFLENKKSKFSIQALKESTVLYITIKDFQTLLEGNNFWQINAGKYYMNIFMEKEAREKQLLTEDAETRYKSFLTEFPGLIDDINHYHIASYLGISNVTLSRIRKKISQDR